MHRLSCFELRYVTQGCSYMLCQGLGCCTMGPQLQPGAAAAVCAAWPRRTCRPPKRHTKRVGTKNDMPCHPPGLDQQPCSHRHPPHFPRESTGVLPALQLLLSGCIVSVTSERVRINAWLAADPRPPT
jgi:hypothetical protein